MYIYRINKILAFFTQVLSFSKRVAWSSKMKFHVILLLLALDSIVYDVLFLGKVTSRFSKKEILRALKTATMNLVIAKY